MELFSLQFHLSSSTIAQLLISSVWQGIAIAATIGILLKVLPGMSAANRFRIWMAALLLASLLPFTSLFSWGNTAVLPDISSAPHSAGTVFTLSMYWSWGLLFVWLSLVAFCFLRLAAGILGIYKLLRSATAVDATSLPHHEQFQRRRKNIRILASDSLSAPVATGFLRPVIVLPSCLLHDLSPEEMRQILLHELEHLERRDDWTTLFIRTLRCLLPLSPALYYIEKQLCRERELACDDAVLDQEISPRGYALCLARMAEISMSRRGVSLAPSLLGETSQLTARVSHILGPQNSMQEMARFPLAVSLAAMAMTASALLCCPKIVSFRALPSPSDLAQSSPVTMKPRLIQASAVMPATPHHTAAKRKAEHHIVAKQPQIRPLTVQQPPIPNSTEMLVLWQAPAEQTVLLFVQTTHRTAHSITIERQFFEI